MTIFLSCVYHFGIFQTQNYFTCNFWRISSFKFLRTISNQIYISPMKDVVKCNDWYHSWINIKMKAKLMIEISFCWQLQKFSVLLFLPNHGIDKEVLISSNSTDTNLLRQINFFVQCFLYKSYVYKISLTSQIKSLIGYNMLVRNLVYFGTFLNDDQVDKVSIKYLFLLSCNLR